MKTRARNYLVIAAGIAVGTGVSGVARAQPSGGSYCSGTTTCFEGTATSNHTIAISGSGTNTYAGTVAGQDTSAGIGVGGFSATGDGLLGVVGDSSYYVATDSAGVLGVFANANTSSGGAPYDSYGSAGVYGTSAVADGGHFLSQSSGYNAVYANNSVGNAIYATGAGGSDFSPAGPSTADTIVAVYSSTTGGSNGVKGTNGSSSTTSSGVFGYHSGAGYGVRGEANSGTGVYGTSTSGTAIEGDLSAATSGAYAGVLGVTGSGGGWGVRGNNTATSGGGAYAGVFGTSTTGYGGYFTTTNGSYAAYFNKDIWVNGGSIGPSDIRLKKNVKPIAGAIDQLLQLKGVTFEWKEPEKHTAGTQIGFIAQDVEKVFPQWVHVNEDGTKGVSVSQVEGLEVEAIRTLKNENDSLKTEVNELRTLVYSMNPNRAGFTFGNGGWGVAGLAIGIAFMAGRRKRDERTA